MGGYARAGLRCSDWIVSCSQRGKGRAISIERLLDLRGLKCPLPVLRTQKRLNMLAPGERIVVECTDPLSVIDIPHMVRQRGDALESKREHDGIFIFEIRRNGMTEQTQTDAKALAALVFETSAEVNKAMADFAAALTARGKKLAGVIQVSPRTVGDCQDLHVLDLATGARKPILQNLGNMSQACRADSAALSEVALIVRQALQDAPDLIFINRFGRLESEGRGMREDIGTALASGVPVVIGVSVHYLEAWRAFAQDIGEELACTEPALEAWWERLEASRGAEQAGQSDALSAKD
jgi:TusA-related sulfurtransferase/nucleoside-triphosphatase THEP1